MDIHLTGLRELTEIRTRMKRISDAGLGKDLARELKAATRPLSDAIRIEAVAVAPSGYDPTLSASLRFPTAVNISRLVGLVTMRVYGDGRSERRDIPALNRGRLRHPVYGRYRRRKYATVQGRRVRIAGGQLIPNPWVAQRIRAGFIDRPVDRLGPDLGRRMNAVIDDTLRKI